MYVAGVGFRPGINNAHYGSFNIFIRIAHRLEQGVPQQRLPAAPGFPFSRSIVFHGFPLCETYFILFHNNINLERF
jgi:hypothetical protein